MPKSLIASKALKRPKVVVLFLTHTAERNALAEFERLRRQTKRQAEAFVLFHQKDQIVTQRLHGVPVWHFTDEQLRELNYHWLSSGIVPGNTHFPLLSFFSAVPHYDFYWVIEHDVRFNGSWRFLFDGFDESNSDFISSHIRAFEEDPAWYWWESLSHPQKTIPKEQRVRSFNPIYRISNQGLRYLHQCHLAGWRGHFEVLIPTLLQHKGFEISDFGGFGSFVAPENRNKFYIDGPAGTMRWRPPFSRIGQRKNKLYHPIKR
jgi:hypothetical protein